MLNFNPTIPPEFMAYLTPTAKPSLPAPIIDTRLGITQTNAPELVSKVTEEAKVPQVSTVDTTGQLKILAGVLAILILAEVLS